VPKRKLNNIPKQDLPRNLGEVIVRYMEPGNAASTGFQDAHRDGYYVFLLQQSGESRLMVDFREALMTGESVFFIRPGQVHYYLSTSNVTGWLVAVNSVLIDESFIAFFEEQNQLGPLSLDCASSRQLILIVNALQTSCLSEDDGYPKAITSHLVSAFAGLIANLYKIAAPEPSGKDGRPFDITRRFRKMVRQDYCKIKRPSQYADKLAISTPYLNECVKSVTGMTVTYWIKQESILEAKRLLWYSPLSIKEISIKIGYADEAYFSRIFSQVTAMTPVSFRKSRF